MQQRQNAMREMLPALDTLRRQAIRSVGRRPMRKQDIGFFRILAEGASQPILVANREAGIEYVNAAWEQQFGYTLDEVRGKNPRLLQSGRTDAAEHDRLWSALERGALFQSNEIIDKRKDGTDVTIRTTIFPVDHNGVRYYVQILEATGTSARIDTLRDRFLRATTV